MSLTWSPDYAPVDGDFADVSLLLLGEGTNGSTTILDSSSNNLSVTAVDNAQISTAVNTPFGTGDGVLAFDGTGDYLTVPMNTSLQPGTGDFTIEGWFYISTLDATMGLFSLGGYTTGILLRRGSATNDLFINNTGYNYSPAAFTIGAWHHIVLTRAAGIVNLWINGQSVLSATNTSNIAPADDLYVGTSQHALFEEWNGYISNLRITKGVARYTSNFTPPTAPFPILSPSTRIEVGDGFDVEAANYILAVEAADAAAGQSGGLEPGVRTAINDFVVGCKSDGIWNAIKASCLLSGARTLEGALVPLKGSAPSKFGTVSNWNYNRKTGLQGDGSTNYLDSNRNNNADPQNSFHLSVYASSVGTTGYGIAAGATDAGTSMLGLGFSVQRSRTGNVFSNVNTAAGFNGHSRSLSNQYTHRTNASNTTLQTTSEAQANLTLFVFARGVVGAPAALSDARIAFYSIGEALPDSPTQTGLELLDTRISDFITAIGAAIP